MIWLEMLTHFKLKRVIQLLTTCVSNIDIYNLLFTTQYIDAIPPVLRRNLDIFVIFKFANVQSVVEQIYQEISGVIKEEDFKNGFEYAT